MKAREVACMHNRLRRHADACAAAHANTCALHTRTHAHARRLRTDTRARVRKRARARSPAVEARRESPLQHSTHHSLRHGSQPLPLVGTLAPAAEPSPHPHVDCEVQRAREHLPLAQKGLPLVEGAESRGGRGVTGGEA